jgi:hypothetical protein
MNWYKIIKLSSPLIEDYNPNEINYLDIGHRNFFREKKLIVKEYVWIINKYWNFEIREVPIGKSSRLEHIDIFEDYAEAIAAGRLEVNTKTKRKLVSMIIRHKDQLQNSPTTYRMMKNQIESILDYEIGNPEIYEF